MQYLSSLSLLLGCLLARTAVADDTTQDPATSPGFSILDRYDGDSRLGFEAGYAPIDTPSEGMQPSGRFDLHAHYVDATYHVGGYAQVQRWVYGGDDIKPGSATGAPELGALYVARVSEHVALVPRIGVVIPTLSMSYNAPMVIAARPSDLYQHDENATFARLGVSPMVRVGRMFARADVTVVAEVAGDSNIPFGLDANVGAGFELGRAAVMAELATITLRSQAEPYRGGDVGSGGPATTSFMAVPAVSVRARFEHVQPYASIAAPIIDRLSWVATAGLDLSLDAY